MRKEEDEDKPTADAQPKADKSARRIPKVVDVDEELQDDALLGEATLAKMSAAREDTPATVTPATEKPVETSAPVPAQTDEAKETKG
jgi:hypothetical protein